LTLDRDPECPLCGRNPSITQVGCSWEVEAKEINPHDYILVDIRESSELQKQRLTNWEFQHLPLSVFDAKCINGEKPYLFFCQKGRRSYDLVHYLRQEGFDNVFSLVGGINQLKENTP